MNARHIATALMAAMACGPSVGIAVPLLGDAQSFAVNGKAGVTNPPLSATSVNGSLGANTSNSVTGFATVDGGAGTVSNGAVHVLDMSATNAQAAILIAIGALNALPGTTGLAVHPEGGNTLGSGGDIDNLTPGVYTFSSSTLLHGTLTLNAGSSLNPVFVFLIHDAITTDALSSVVMSNGGGDAGVFWVTGTFATLGDNSTFEGNILAGSAITLDPGAQIVCGRAFAQTAVTFAGKSSVPRDNKVDSLGCEGTAGVGSPTESSGFSGGLAFTDSGELALIGTAPVGAVPEPPTLALLGIALLGFAPHLRRRRTGRCSPVR